MTMLIAMANMNITIMKKGAAAVMIMKKFQL